MVQDVVDVDRLLGERPLVAEHLHAVDEIADALGLGADELGQRAVFVGQVLLEKLGGAADARQRVLDLVGKHAPPCRRPSARRRDG